ncbi:RsmE family RNA methyltransferase [Candidatus Neptunochlamydia vexilliferae]|nr:RsmE family RNA methyltransferase [Candidatus Neptunochlamydia vexilliferae]
MPHDRFYINAPLEKKVLLTGEEFSHLTRVMRKKEGDTIELVNGKNVLATSTIETITKKEAHITIGQSTTHPPALPSLTLVQALPKLSNLELILQKGTELGVSTFALYPSARSEKKELSKNQEARFHRIIIGAMKQCGRLDLPQLTWGFPNIEGNAYFGDLRSGAPALSSVSKLPATLIIGPEGGFTDDEVKHLETLAQGVRLASYTLRTETAALAGISILASSYSL